MAQKLDKIVVIDIESTCWEGTVPNGMDSDIIEIGICLLDVKNGEISANKGIFTFPERSSISPFCTELTTITPQMVQDEGIKFVDALKILTEEYQCQSRGWASYGAYDLKQFQRQCNAFKTKYPFGPSHLNIKTLFAAKNKLDHEVGMAQALEILNIEQEGTHHRGKDDAKNIAKILWQILK